MFLRLNNDTNMHIECDHIRFNHLDANNEYKPEINLQLTVNEDIDTSIAQLDAILQDGNQVTDLYVGTNEMTQLYDLHGLEFSITQLEDMAQDDQRFVSIIIENLGESILTPEE